MKGNLTIIRQYLRAYENNDQVKINSYLDKNYRYFAPGGKLSFTLEERKNDEEYFFKAFKVIAVKIEEHIEEKDKIALHIFMKCRHIGDYLGIGRTNKEILISYMEIIQIRNGNIFREWAEFDIASILDQIKAN